MKVRCLLVQEQLKQFRIDMLDEIRNECKINYSDPTSEFLNFYTDKLITAEEILEFEEYDIEVIGKNKRKARIDGYSYDSLERSISLFIADFSNNDEIQTLTNTAIEQLKNRVINFLDFVFNNYIQQNLEESSAAFQLSSEILSKKDFINKIKIYIFSDATLSNYVKDISVDDYIDKKVELMIWDINRIFNLVNASLKKEDLNIDLSEFDSRYIPCLKAIEDKEYDSYLAVIDGELLADLYIKYGARLLEGNVRSFLSVRGKINKGIRKTIREDPEIFFVFNNGIACTATNAEIVETNEGLVIKKITNFQIINGGQTTASIANAILQDKARDNVKKISVPMKLTVINEVYIEEQVETNFDYEADENIEQKKEAFISELTSNIARFANSQNKVDESDFFSNHPFHIRFESLARKVYAPPTNGIPYETIWFYERAKGQYTQEQMKLTNAEKKRFANKYPKKQVIKKIDLAKYLMTYYQKPHIVSKGNQFNMRLFATEIEKEWKQSKDHSNFNVYYYKKCIALAILFKNTELLVSHSDWYQAIKSYRANIVTYTISSIFYLLDKYCKGFELDFMRIWNDQKVYPELEQQINILTKVVYDFITDETRPTQNVTEWCKKEACWDRAKNLMDKKIWFLEIDFIKTLVSKSENDSNMVNEKKSQQEIDGIQYQTKVINLGEEYWEKALFWGCQMKMLNETEISFLKSATNFTKHIPTDKQCKKILDIQFKLEEEGFKGV